MQFYNVRYMLQFPLNYKTLVWVCGTIDAEVEVGVSTEVVSLSPPLTGWLRCMC